MRVAPGGRTGSPSVAAHGAGPRAPVALPRLLVLTDRAATPRPLPDVVRAAVDGGARAVVLREKDLPDVERRRLADELRPLLEAVGGLLVLAGGALRAAPGAVDALHLAAAEPLPVPRPALLGRSCHDAAEVRRARAEGCDWVSVSPVYLTASKPGYGPALGPSGLAELVRGAPPVYALGGIDPSRARECVDAGAHGVAVMGAVMRADHPARLVAELLSSLPEPPGLPPAALAEPATLAQPGAAPAGGYSEPGTAPRPA